MALNDVLSEVAKRLGLKDTEIGTMRRKQEELSDAIRNGHDRLDGLKERVDKLDAQLLEKKREYDAAGPGRRQIVKEELKLLFQRQDRSLEPVRVITQRLQAYQLLKDKIDQLIFVAENPSRTEEIDEITLDMEDMLDEQQAESKAVRELEGVSCMEQEEDAKFDERLNAIGGMDETESPSTVDSMDERIAQLA